jgi:hypothetical protein
MGKITSVHGHHWERCLYEHTCWWFLEVEVLQHVQTTKSQHALDPKSCFGCSDLGVGCLTDTVIQHKPTTQDVLGVLGQYP